MAANVQLDYDAIVKKIESQILTLQEEICNNDTYSSSNALYAKISPLIKDVKFRVNLEQTFIQEAQKNEPNEIFVNVRFGRASTNFGASMCSIFLSILGPANKIKPAHMFFCAFAAKYSTQQIGNDASTTQIWVTPTVQSNFNEFAIEFRSLFEVSGTLIVGNSIVKVTSGIITYYYNESSSESIPFMAFQDNLRNVLAPQPFGNTHGFAKSEVTFSTYTFSFSTYLLDTQLVADCMHLKGFAQAITGGKTSTKNLNDNFKLIITFTNGFTNSSSEAFYQNFKLVDCSITNNFGEIPMFTASFSR